MRTMVLLVNSGKVLKTIKIIRNIKNIYIGLDLFIYFMILSDHIRNISEVIV